jgi:hypothetical protein
MFERSIFSSEAQWKVVPTGQNNASFDVGSIANITRMSVRGGYSQIHFDEKTEKFEE